MANARLGAVFRQFQALAPPHADHPADADLLRAFLAAGDEDAFAALVRRHGPMVLGVSRRVLGDPHDAEDAFQAAFVHLAQNARPSVRKQESLGGWLHGVAYRMARNAKRAADRRRRHEARATPPRPPAPPADVSWREVQGVFEEELQRLPGALRAAFVLCCLENMPAAGAARELGLGAGTVSNRVCRARKLLRERLAARGVSLAAVLGTLSLTGTRAAAVPRALAASTVKVVTQLAAGRGAADVVPAAVAALLREAKTVMSTKLKAAALAALGLGFGIAGAGLLANGNAAAGPAGPPPAGGAKSPAPADEPAARMAGKVVLGGRVLDPEGKPVAGARVYVLGDRATPRGGPEVRATTGADGRFEFAVAGNDLGLSYGLVDPWKAVFVVATADGFGLALAQPGDPARARDQTLRLARDDVPVRGRVLDLEGRPVAGATVRVDSLRTPTAGDLTAWLDDLKTRPDGYPAENRFLTALSHPALAALFPEVTTGKDGRFRLTGVGRERVAGLTIAGPAVETRQVRVRTRPGEAIRRLEWKDFPQGGTLTYYGSDFDHTAGPTRPVTGVVRDKGTGRPVAGAVVMSQMLAGENFSGRDFIRATTDRDGRYRLVGLPAGEGNRVRAVGPDGQPYLPADRPVADPPGTADAAVDFELVRGVWVSGRATDRVTGRPVPGAVEYFVFKDNPHLKDVDGGGDAVHHRLQTGPDGSFRFVGLPGRSLVAVRAHGDRYVTGVGAERYAERDDFGNLTATSPRCHAKGFHAFAEVEAAAGADGVTCDVPLDPGVTVTGVVRGPDGEPLEGARMCGAESYAFTSWSHEPLKGAEFKVFGMRADRRRAVVFLHDGKKLAGARVVRGDETGPLAVKLEPWGVVTGRLVTAGGQGRAGADLRFAYGPKGYDDPALGTHPTRSFPTDGDGRFRIEGLVPGLQYHLAVVEKGVQYDVQTFSVTSGQSKDLGDVQAGAN